MHLGGIRDIELRSAAGDCRPPRNRGDLGGRHRVHGEHLITNNRLPTCESNIAEKIIDESRRPLIDDHESFFFSHALLPYSLEKQRQQIEKKRIEFN